MRLLIEQRLGSDSDLKEWLDEKGIPGKSRRKIGRGYEDTALLWLIDDGNHWNRIKQRIQESIVFFSENLSPPVVSVELHSRLATTWAEIKSN